MRAGARYLEHNGPPGARRRYDETLVSDDLRYHLDVPGKGDAEYRAAFMAHAGAFLASAGPGVEDRLPPIQRLKWRLVREERLDELLAVLEQPTGARQRDGPPGPPRPPGADRAAARSGAAAREPRLVREHHDADPVATPSLDSKAAT